ncbi:SDR family oxidoreductase [Streptomyces specialis]|uniref:SDR family oxidoreductase n=1 Tax=Streptomyces specialis TaxID=498367 RepID=UPI00073F8EFE|nr:SDR family oxidoreductase [Streptomyces specialis]
MKRTAARTTRRTILITGASAGLGEQMARDFAALGRDLALCARRTDRLERLREELLARHPDRRVTVHALDVNDHERVFEVFRSWEAELGTLDRVIVNAGLGQGRPVGTGGFEETLRTVHTNFTAALAQCEAAMELFRARGAGHLVVISSMTAMRGMAGHLAAYAASKAGVSVLAEGIRAEMIGTPIAVTTIHPGYIASELNNRRVGWTTLTASTEKGVRAMVRAIEAERAEAAVPPWPWTPIGFAMRHLPLRLVSRGDR